MIQKRPLLRYLLLATVLLGAVAGWLLLRTDRVRPARWLLLPQQRISVQRISALAFTQHSTGLASADEAGEIVLWDLARASRNVLAGHTGYPLSLAFSPDAKLLASAGDDKSVEFWDVTSTKLLHTGRHPFTVCAVTFSPDGSIVASSDGFPAVSGQRACVKLWRAQLGTELATLTQGGPLPDTDALISLTFSPDGSLIAAGNHNGSIRTWDVAKREQAAFLPSSHGDVYALRFSPDGRSLAAAYRDGTIDFLDPATLALQESLAAPREYFSCMDFSLDAKFLVAGTDEGWVTLFDIERRKCRARLVGLAHPVMAVAFASDQRTVAGAGHERAIALWDVSSYTQGSAYKAGGDR